MSLQDLNMGSGKWVVANCGKFPSERDCKLVLMAPERQREDLLNAATAHAVRDHGHTDTPELRTELGKILDTVEV